MQSCHVTNVYIHTDTPPFTLEQAQYDIIYFLASCALLARSQPFRSYCLSCKLGHPRGFTWLRLVGILKGSDNKALFSCIHCCWWRVNRGGLNTKYSQEVLMDTCSTERKGVLWQPELKERPITELDACSSWELNRWIITDSRWTGGDWHQCECLWEYARQVVIWKRSGERSGEMIQGYALELDNPAELNLLSRRRLLAFFFFCPGPVLSVNCLVACLSRAGRLSSALAPVLLSVSKLFNGVFGSNLY